MRWKRLCVWLACTAYVIINTESGITGSSSSKISNRCSPSSVVEIESGMGKSSSSGSDSSIKMGSFARPDPLK